MNSYRITLQLHSPLGTPLKADTLWGHIAWGIRYHQGEAALEAWLNRYDQDDSPLILSDPLPSGFWPRPVLPPAMRPAEPPTPQDADEFKKLDKLAWVSHQAWNQVSENVSSEEIHACLKQLSQQSNYTSPQTMLVAHAGINRLTGGTHQPDGSSLFSTEQTFYSGESLFDVWIQSPESMEVVRNWMNWAVEGGYGRDASIGLGHLTISDIVAAAPPQVSAPNAVMLLAAAVAHSGDPYQGFFATAVKSGRVGGSFAIGHLPEGITQRQKRPVTTLLAGTVLFIESEVPCTVGRVISGIHEWKEIRHYGIAPVLPLKVNESTMQYSFLSQA